MLTGFRAWLQKTFGWRKPSLEMVGFLDTETRRVVRIPAAELRPGAVQVRIQGSDEVVWALEADKQNIRLVAKWWRTPSSTDSLM